MTEFEEDLLYLSTTGTIHVMGIVYNPMHRYYRLEVEFESDDDLYQKPPFPASNTQTHSFDPLTGKPATTRWVSQKRGITVEFIRSKINQGKENQLAEQLARTVHRVRRETEYLRGLMEPATNVEKWKAQFPEFNPKDQPKDA